MACRLLACFLICFCIPSLQVFADRPTNEQLKELQTHLGYKFQDETTLLLALTHASYSRSNNGALSVLGSNVAGSAIALYYVVQNVDIAKGDLQRNISTVADTHACARFAESLAVDELIMVAKAEERISDAVLARAYHALFGAISVDRGLNKAAEVYWNLMNWQLPNNMVSEETTLG